MELRRLNANERKQLTSKGVEQMIGIFLPLSTAALVATVISTMVYVQSRQNRIDQECLDTFRDTTDQNIL